MGTYSDADHSLPFLKNNEIQEAQKINNLTAAALKDKYGHGYKGVLYGGFIATSKGVKLIEYNARFGDPEAMNALSLLDTDFIDICLALTNGTLKNLDVNFLNMASVCKYAVPKGYPNNPIKNEEINVGDINNTNGLFYASVNKNKNKIMLAGSRAVAVVAIADTISKAEVEAEKEILCLIIA
jgi:fusion protein PurCD